MKVKNMVFGTLLCIAGAAIGLYLGLWWAFIGGIVDVITEIRAPELSAANIAMGVVKVLFAGAIGGISALCFLAPGAALIKKA